MRFLPLLHYMILQINMLYYQFLHYKVFVCNLLFHVNNNFTLGIDVHLRPTNSFLGYYKSYYTYGKLYRKKICRKICKKVKKLRRVCIRRCRRVKQKLCRLVSKKRLCRSYPYCYNKPYCKLLSIKSMWKWLWCVVNINDTLETQSDSLRLQIWCTSVTKIRFIIRFLEVLSWIYRSNFQRCSVKKGVFKNFPNFTGRPLVVEHLFNEVAGLSLATLKRDSNKIAFLWN